MQKLFLIEVYHEGDEGDDQGGYGDSVVDEIVDLHEISLHAIYGVTALNTMREWHNYFHDVFKLHGMPKLIVCDQDPIFTRSHPKEWLKWLAWVEYCYNTSWHSSIKTTPFEVVYSCQSLTLLTYMLGMAKVETVEKQLNDHDQQLKELRTTLAKAQNQMK
ncbi:hypothetical protein NE237_029456 [Protea cynaroides]|uniref:Integrase catalytic domain-containing protein n=1 Tax=Protea cynaroides TaxID=273540 RepID=A0A9Q0JTX7_9MAGN|nr:hypothetical protein NE237_029456 [Protea cynaroides]